MSSSVSKPEATPRGTPVKQLTAVGALFLLSVISTSAEMRWVDIERSTVTIYVSTSSAPHNTPTDHVLKAPLAEGSLEDTDEPHLALVINVAELRLVDPESSPEEHRKTRLQMLGPNGLDADQFSRITYHSLTINRSETNVWLVQGELGMHGSFLPLNVTATRQGDRFTGTASVLPTDFGIPALLFTWDPTLVNSHVLVDFDIVLEAP
jgi:hypothetical protein